MSIFIDHCVETVAYRLRVGLCAIPDNEIGCDLGWKGIKGVVVLRGGGGGRENSRANIGWGCKLLAGLVGARYGRGL